MREYIFVQIILLLVFISVGIRIIQNIRIDRRINRVYRLSRRPERYIGGGFERLPESVRAYLETSGAMRRQAPRRLKVNYRGMVRKKKGNDWWRFTIKSYVNLERGSYLVDGCMRVFPGIRARMIEEWSDGQGRFELLMSSMFKYMEGIGEPFDYNATLNYMIMCCLSPIYLGQDDFRWKDRIGQNRYRMTFERNGIRIEGTATFDSDHRLHSITTSRYRGEKDRYALAPFEARFEQYKTMDYCQLPTVIRYGWLDGEKFHNYANFEVVKYQSEKI